MGSSRRSACVGVAAGANAGRGDCRNGNHRRCAAAARSTEAGADARRRRGRGRATWFERLESRWVCAGNMTTDDPVAPPPSPVVTGPGSESPVVVDQPVESGTPPPAADQLDNRAPVALADSVFTLEDESVWIDVLANDVDPDGDLAPESLQVLVPPEHGRVSVDPVSANVRYAPDANYFGTDTLWYAIADRCGNVATASVTIAVASVADALADLRVVGGVNDTQGALPRSSADGRLELTQGDSVRFDAIAASADGFAPGEPVWIVRVGDRVEQTAGVTTLDVKFDRYAPRGRSSVTAVTPSTGEQFVTVIDLVPHPVSLDAPRFGQTPPSVWVNSHRLYGTEYFRQATPSAGAPVEALREFADAGDLRILRAVDFSPSPLGTPPEDSLTRRGITRTGEVDDDGRIATSYFSLSDAVENDALHQSYQAAVRWYWESRAADSPRAGQPVELATGGLTFTLDTMQDGFHIVSNNDGLIMRQPYVGTSPWPMWRVTPNPIPAGDIALAEITGTVTITRADAVRGRKTFDVVVYDDDGAFDTPLQTVTVSLSLPRAQANQQTPFRAVVPVFNRGGFVALQANSWEQSAELYWQAASVGLVSPIENVETAP